MSQPLAGDGSVSVDVTAQQATDPWAKAGPMIRATNDPGSPYYAALVTPGNGIAVQWRSTQGGLSTQLVVPGTVPGYLKVARYSDPGSGDVYYTAYTSPDGVTWTPVAGSTQQLTMASGPLLAGFALTSHDQGTSGAVTLTDVNVSSGEPPSPRGSARRPGSVRTSAGLLPAGQDSLSGGTWSEVAGGGDIWGAADSFHLVSQALAGDGSVTSDVTAQQATDPWAKAGPMIRATADPGSPYYAALVTPGNGIAVQWRTAQGGSTSQLTVPGVVPIHLKVAQYTAPGTGHVYYTAYTSPDGVTWTAIAGSTQQIRHGRRTDAGRVGRHLPRPGHRRSGHPERRRRVVE